MLENAPSGMRAQRRFRSASAIRIFTGRTLDSQGCKVSSNGQRRLRLFDTQAVLSLHWAHMCEGTFSDVTAQMISLRGIVVDI